MIKLYKCIWNPLADYSAVIAYIVYYNIVQISTVTSKNIRSILCCVKNNNNITRFIRWQLLRRRITRFRKYNFRPRPVSAEIKKRLPFPPIFNYIRLKLLTYAVPNQAHNYCVKYNIADLLRKTRYKPYSSLCTK